MPPKARKSGRRTGASRKSRTTQDRLSSGLTSASVLEQLGDDAVTALGRDYYLLIISQLERQVVAYESYLEQLTADYDALTLKNIQTDEAKKETLHALRATFQDKIDEATDLIHRICGRYAIFEVVQKKWKERELELQAKKRYTEEQMRLENNELAAELSDLEYFRTNRDSLIQQYKTLEAKLDQLNAEHAEALKNLVTRDTAYRTRLKQATARRLNEVATTFRDQSYQLIEPTYKRMLAENVSIEGQLVKLSDAVRRMSEDDGSLVDKFRELLIEQTRLEEEQVLLATRSSAAMKLIHLLVLHKAELDELAAKAKLHLEATSNVRSECTQLQTETERLAKTIQSIERKLTKKKNRYRIMRDCFQLHMDGVENITECLLHATRPIQSLLKEVDVEMDSELVTEKTIAMIGQILAHLSLAQPHLVGGANGFAMDKTPLTRESTTETELSYEIDGEKGNDVLEAMVNNPVDVVDSDISAAHSSYEEDDELEISEPEREITTVEELNERLSKSSGRSKSQTTLSRMTSCRESSVNSLQRLDQLWCRIQSEPLDPYMPGSRMWRDILGYLSKNLESWTARTYNLQTEPAYMQFGALKLIPSASAVILSKRQQLDSLRQAQLIRREQERQSVFGMDDPHVDSRRSSTMKRYAPESFQQFDLIYSDPIR